MIEAHDHYTAMLLSDGRQLVVGGFQMPDQGDPASAELFDPVTGTWSSTANRVSPRGDHTATLLLDGRVLVAGGYTRTYLPSAEVFDLVAGTWSTTGDLMEAGSAHRATLLRDGTVLVMGGGYTAGGNALASAELYHPGSGG